MLGIRDFYLPESLEELEKIEMSPKESSTYEELDRLIHFVLVSSCYSIYDEEFMEGYYDEFGEIRDFSKFKPVMSYF